MKPPISLEQLLGRPPDTAEAKRAPRQIYAAGPAKIPLAGPRVSIVGTRRPSERGVAYAAKLAGDLAARGATVVSGLAAGIDAAAHRAAIERGGATIAVLGTPLDRAYPQRNAALQEEIMLKHLAISQFGPREPVRKGNFVMRNLTMALISDATVIVEAGDNSGTAHQGKEAVRLGRPLFFMDAVGRYPWTDALRRRGARSCRGADDVLGRLSGPSGPAQARLA